MSVDDPAFEAVVDRVAELLRLRIGLRPDSSLRGRLRRSHSRRGDGSQTGSGRLRQHVDHP